ncbi:MAG: hypothetical protein Q9169_004541 [Polycauliona sp. 2 TL-2023]
MASSDKSPTRLSIAVLGTCDTKLQELLYLRSQILSHAEDASIILVDLGRTPQSHPAISIPQDHLLKHHGSSTHPNPSTIPRNEVTQTMADCATACLEDLYSKQSIHAVISVGGSSGTSLTSSVMRRALPFLFPKMIVSTMASGDTAPYVGERDITLMYSIVDIAGSNAILNGVLDNAAGAIVGMARAYWKRQIHNDDSITVDGNPERNQEKERKEKKIRIAITMFGVTTPCVDTIRQHLTTHYSSSSRELEIYIFHATGHGGRALERLISSGEIDAVIDLTTSEITDEICGGILSAGPRRLEAGLKAGIPYVISVGACEMINFGTRNTIPERYLEEKGRKIYEHNPSVTLVRANSGEMRMVGEFIVDKVRRYCKDKEMVKVVLPMVGGMSPLSAAGGPFEDREADEVFLGVIEKGLEGSGVKVERDGRGVCDEGFAVRLAEGLMELIRVRDGEGMGGAVGEMGTDKG